MFHEAPNEKNVHTEHCCSYPDCGCKYGDEGCSVVTGEREQSVKHLETSVCSDMHPKSAIQNDHQLQVTREAVNSFYRGLTELRRERSRCHTSWFKILAEGPLCDIRRMEREINDYTGWAKVAGLTPSLSPNRILGVLFGQAIGDALGLPMEFRSAHYIRTSGHVWKYVDTHRNGTLAWRAGEWSDDTERAIALLSAYIQGRNAGRSEDLLPDKLLCAKNLVEWLKRDPRGCGSLTKRTLTSEKFLTDPVGVSSLAWFESRMLSAPNGAVMGTSYVGLMRPWDLDWTAKAAYSCAIITHYDPRCAASSMAVSVLIAALVMGMPLDTAVEEAIVRAQPWSVDTREQLNVKGLSVEDLLLDEGLPKVGFPKKDTPIGYTWKCARVAFWVAHEASRLRSVGTPEGEIFQKVLAQVLSAGGDTDTNGAVAAAVLGGLLGFAMIPSELSEGVLNWDQLVGLFCEVFFLHTI